MKKPTTVFVFVAAVACFLGLSMGYVAGERASDF